MNEILIGTIGFLAGVLLGAAIFAGRLAAARMRLENEQNLSRERELLYKKSEAQLEDGFRLISAKLLKENQESFLTLARSELEKQQLEGTGSLEKKEQAIRGLVDPMKVILGEVKGRMEAIEKDYRQTFTEVKEQFRNLRTTRPSSRWRRPTWSRPCGRLRSEASGARSS